MRLRTCLAAGAVLLGAGVLLPAADDPPALAGRWQLNEKESENPEAKFRPLRPGEDPQRPDRDENAGRKPRADRPSPGQQPAKLEAPPGLLEFLEPPRTLSIAKNETEVMLDDGKSPLTLPTDGSEHKQGALTASARVEGQSLIVEKRNEQGARLTVRYSLLPGRRKLEVYSRLAGTQGRAVTLRRVYDGAEPAA